ncbi:hypothetical protein ACFORL_12570 [Legionella dresdenensis]|uniref:Uncharacterized protein n=1 Tax=Legionella dresdenensis TaxID=450200 RepID=A0ABV8CHZ0_9GAMM
MPHHKYYQQNSIQEYQGHLLRNHYACLYVLLQDISLVSPFLKAFCKPSDARDGIWERQDDFMRVCKKPLKERAYPH